jgi:hypothetical protein
LSSGWKKILLVPKVVEIKKNGALIWVSF